MKILVVDGRANVNDKTSDGNPLLYRAILGQFVDIVRVLVVDGSADVNARTADDEALLAVAKKTRNEQIIKILQDAGATEE